MQSQQLLMKSQVFKDEVLTGTESADQPADEMSERRDHSRNHIGKSSNQAFRQVIHFAGVRRFGEAQAESSDPAERLSLEETDPRSVHPES